MKSKKLLTAALPFIVVGSLSVGQSVLAGFPIAGLTPEQRPAEAPTIEWVRHDQAWYQHALTGVSRPYPRSLYFLDNQGDWYTPFSQPGMTGPYDIRGWHPPYDEQ